MRRPRTKSANRIDKHVGGLVRIRRMTQNMSQAKLGVALGVSFQQIQKYERGINRIGASRLQHISQILHVPVAFFFEGAPDVSAARGAKTAAASPAAIMDFMATSEGLALAKAFMRLTNIRLRRRIVDLVDEIAD
jgi:transcriptional regulator with XRE-family HTH domain